MKFGKQCVSKIRNSTKIETKNNNSNNNKSEIPELKNTMNKVKNLIESFNNRLN